MPDSLTWRGGPHPPIRRSRRRGQPLWQLTQMDVMPRYGFEAVLEWMEQHPILAAHWLKENELCSPVV